MQPEIARQLLDLNQQFYQTFAQDFSDTRQRLQPGVSQVLAMVTHNASLLDLGCGNGTLATYLFGQGHTGTYIGVDGSIGLVNIANKLDLKNARFIHSDLADPEWDAVLPMRPFDFIFCFAVMHHIPGEELRLAFLHKVRTLLAPQGRFVLSNWQFLESEKWRERIQPWEEAGLTSADVDEYDYLIDWRRGGRTLRYVHFFDTAELTRLARQTGFRVSGLFTSDGESGNLGLYHIWEGV